MRGGIGGSGGRQQEGSGSGVGTEAEEKAGGKKGIVGEAEAAVWSRHGRV